MKIVNRVFGIGTIVLFCTSMGCSDAGKNDPGTVVVQVHAPDSVGTAKKRPVAVHKASPTAPPAGHGQRAQPRLPAGHPPVGKRLPAGHPPVSKKSPPVAPQPGVGPLPLLKVGPGSEAELTRVGKQITDKADRAVFAQAFRQVFTVQRAKRNPVAAVQALQQIRSKYPKAAAIPRVLGYAAVDHGFQHKLAMKHYQKAVELDPSYGEVHYALAFMYVIGSEKAKGGIHYIKSLELGIKDNRNIGKRFYPDLVP